MFHFLIWKNILKNIINTKQIQLRTTHKHSGTPFFDASWFFGIRLIGFIILIEVMSLITSPRHVFEWIQSHIVRMKNVHMYDKPFLFHHSKFSCVSSKIIWDTILDLNSFQQFLTDESMKMMMTTSILNWFSRPDNSRSLWEVAATKSWQNKK